MPDIQATETRRFQLGYDAASIIFAGIAGSLAVRVTDLSSSQAGLFGIVATLAYKIQGPAAEALSRYVPLAVTTRIQHLSTFQRQVLKCAVATTTAVLVCFYGSTISFREVIGLSLVTFGVKGFVDSIKTFSEARALRLAEENFEYIPPELSEEDDKPLRERVDETSKGKISDDPFVCIPADIMKEIFLTLEPAAYKNVCLVNKRFNYLGSDPDVLKKMMYWQIVQKNRLYGEPAFSNKKWEQHLGVDAIKGEKPEEEFTSLRPYRIINTYRALKEKYPSKKWMLLRVPKTLNEELNLKTLTNLFKLVLRQGKHATHFLDILRLSCDDKFQKELENIKIDKSRWVIIGTNLVSQPTDNFDKQVATIARETGIPLQSSGILETLLCIFAYFVENQKFPYPHSLEEWPSLVIRCNDKINDKLRASFWDFDHNSGTVYPVEKKVGSDPTIRRTGYAYDSIYDIVLMRKV